MALTSRHSSSDAPLQDEPSSPNEILSPDQPPTPAVPEPVRGRSANPSAGETNEAIRALVDSRAGRDWSSEAYEVLLIEWAAATRGPGPDMVEAA